MSKKSQWLDRSLFISPYYYKLCLTEKDFHKELKSLKISKKDWPVFTKGLGYAKIHEFTSDTGGMCAIIACTPKPDLEDIEIYAVLVHEAQHLWRWIKEEIGENKPSAEFEAYAMQSITSNLFRSYKEQTKKKRK